MGSNRIARSDLLTLSDYEAVRKERLARIIALKTARRVEVGPWVSFVFENRETVLYQIQEMLRIERIEDPAMIDHEIETYAELLPGEGELSATMFIEITDAEQRRTALGKLGGIERTAALRAGDKKFVAYDKRPIDRRFERPGQATAVYYLGFKVPEKALPDDVWLELSHPQYRHAAALTESLRSALATDLA